MSLLLIGVSCSPKPAAEEPISFPVAEPGRAAASYEREYVAEVQAIQRAEVNARIKGYVESVAIEEGQRVKAGQLLFTISAKELQQEFRRARAATASAAAELKAAQTERANLQMLLDRRIVSPAEVAVADAKIQALMAKVDEAKAAEGQAAINLSYAEVRAPFSGVVNRLPKKAGNIVDEDDLLTTITNASEVFAYFRVSEPEYLEYMATKGEGRAKEVSLKLANGDRLPATGVIDATETEVDNGTGMISFRARFPNEGGILKHGSSGKVIVTSYVHDALTVPQKSTFEVQDHVYVYVLDDDGTAHARRIMPKLRVGDAFVVESGIAPGERFIAEGVQKIKDGAKVVVRTDTAQAEPAR